MNYIKAFISNTLKTKKELVSVSNFLQNGFYYCLNSKFIRIRPFLLLFMIPYVNVCRIKSNNEKNKVIHKGRVFGGRIKTAIVQNDRVLLIYPSKRMFEGRLRYIKNIEMLLYPKMQIIDIDEDNCLVSAEYLQGKHYNDNNHTMQIFHYLLTDERIINSSIIEKKKIGKEYNIVSFWQHGDCHAGNVVWIEDEFKFIDLDNVDLLPAFFDVFYYFAYSCKKRIQGVIENEQLIELMGALLKKKNCYYNNFLDIYLSLFVRFYCFNRMDSSNYHSISEILDSISILDKRNFYLSITEVDKCYVKAEAYKKQ